MGWDGAVMIRGNSRLCASAGVADAKNAGSRANAHAFHKAM
jgi:hypothetical protein